MVEGEGAQDLRQKGGDEILRGAEAQAAAQPRAGEELPGALARIEDQLGVADQRVALGRQGERVRVAQEQAAPELFFQSADVVADGGLTQPELARCLGEA